MPSTDIYHKLNLEDKIRWEEWAPSLQDKLKSLYNQLAAIEAYMDHAVGSVRITIGKDAPDYPVPFNELWFDTNFNIVRIYTPDGWKLTHGAYYGGKNDDIQDTSDSPLSHNPTTNCHCYTIQWKDASFCHCKSQPWTDKEQVDAFDAISFNKFLTNTVNTKQYRFVVESAAPTSGMDAILYSLNANTSEDRDVITPSYTIRLVKNELGQQTNYVSVDEKFDPIFDGEDLTILQIPRGFTYIPFTFGNNTIIKSIHGRLVPYSSGPVYVNLQYKNNNGGNWINVFNNNIDGRVTGIKLAGNYIPYSKCHGSCHCARW